MKQLFLTATCIILGLSCFAQINPDAENAALPELSDHDKEALRQLPVLELPVHLMGKGLPPIVDNSTQPYMRDVFQQHMYSCGQAAGVAYNFTYEIDRVRDVPANTNANLYPTHFTWNWMNSGYGYYGVSFLHSFQILKQCGCMNVADYGGSLHYGGETRWISGYNEYYNGMSNRINNAYQIQVGTPEGLETFKNWIHNHLENSSVGGVGSFYSQYMAATNTLPPGTPEEGKYVLTYFGGSANHAQTIVGYNDSIRWDYNGDGQYTNHLDINNDGEVNMKDWEIGGFKMVQSYGGVPGWGDQGYAYMMYKTVADDLGEGGIWNHAIYVLDVKEDCEPQATMKVTLTHNKREFIKVVAGVANNINATYPEYILEYPILNYQGGEQYMQGGWSPPENKTIEFGLDISPLIGEIILGQDAKFFLQVYEYDPSGTGTGEINSFSVIDYTGGMVEHMCPQTNVPISNHDLTSLSVTATFDFNRVHITNTDLPTATVGVPYYTQLSASGGTQPYTFGLLKIYDETVSSETFPNISANQLSPGNNGSGFVTQELDFDFPFYDSVYSSVTVHVDGYLMFDEQLYPYPYFIDDMNMFKITRHISPFMCHAIRLYGIEGDGLWYEGDASEATFRWKASIDGNSSSTDINVAVRLFPDGKIEFMYGDIVIGDDVLWVPGLSDGNSYDLQFSDFYFDTLPSPGSKYVYNRYNFPDGLTVSENGLISGFVTQPVVGESLTFKVTDNNFISDTETFVFNAFASSGIMIFDSISSGGDSIIEYGEVASLSVELIYVESDSLTGGGMTISTDDPYITILDDYEYFGNMYIGVPLMLEGAFSFQVDPDIPNEHSFEIETSITGTSKQTWTDTLYYTAYAPVIELEDVFINDPNGRLDPGETADMILHINNSGGSRASVMQCLLNNPDPYITINIDSQFVATLEVDSNALLTYNVTADPSTPIGHLTTFDLDITGNLGFDTIISFDQRIGLTLEDFETGDFSLFNWGFMGTENWMIDDMYPYEGSFCSRSGAITHLQECSLILDVEVIEAGDISFFRMVSCEDDAANNSDYLAFYVDGTEMIRWDGERNWEQFSYSLSEGYHRLKWTYSKNASVSAGLDAAFIDNISFPGFLDLNPQLSFSPMEWDKVMQTSKQDQDTLFVSNPNQGSLEFDIEIAEVTDGRSNDARGPSGKDVSWLSCEVCNGSVPAGEEMQVLLTFNTEGLDDGDYYCEIIINDNFQHLTIIPVHLLVDTDIGIDMADRSGNQLSVFPNPSSGALHLRYTIHETRYTKLELYSAKGVKMKTLLDKTQLAGQYEHHFDLKGLPQGLYLLSFWSGNEHAVRKLIYKP